MGLIKTRGCVYRLEYHIIWCTKYRKKILTTTIENRLIELLHNYAASNNFKILLANGDKDHIHLLIEATPTTNIPIIIKEMKGFSARMLRKEFPQIRNSLYGKHIWSPSYFISTVSENTEQDVKEYIKSQKERSYANCSNKTKRKKN